MFITFDGVDGTGKSTQIELLSRWLRDRSLDVVTCRDPGSTALGEAIRALLLGGEMPIHRRSEMLLFMAARSQLVEELIRPALAAGKTVICDRFLLATAVYQGHAGGLDVNEIWRVGTVATGGLKPHLTVLLDMPADRAIQRIHREHDRIESQGQSYLEDVRQGFLTESVGRPEITVVDAAGDRGEVQRSICRAVESLLSGC